MEYKLNQVVKITKPWSGSPFKKGDFAVVRGVFQTDSDFSVMYVLESMSNDYIYSLYPSEFTYVSYGDSIRAMSDEELAELFYDYTQVMNKEDSLLTLEDWFALFQKPFVEQVNFNEQGDIKNDSDKN